MSWEGYDQVLCTMGHLSNMASPYSWEEPKTFICPKCSSLEAFRWIVDLTNGEVEGDDSTFPYPFEEVERVQEVCNLGFTHVHEVRYKIPESKRRA